MNLGTPQQLLSADLVDEAEVSKLNKPFKLLNSIAGPATLPNHTLTLQNGYVVIPLLNIQPKKGRVNGSR